MLDFLGEFMLFYAIMERKLLIVLICLFFSLAIFVLTTQKAMAFSFSISLDPQQGFIDKGGVLKAAINIYSSSSERERVSLFPAVEPEGTRIRFSPSSCRPSCSSIMTISTYKEAEDKNYSIPVVATGKGVSRTATYYLTIGSPSPSLEIPLLVSPPNNSTISSLSPVLDWSDVKGAKFYHWALGNKNGTTVKSFLAVPQGTLNYNTKYDWKVKACNSQEDCSDWSEPQSFITPKNRETLLAALRSQIAAIEAAILSLQKQLMRLIGSGFFKD